MKVAFFTLLFALSGFATRAQFGELRGTVTTSDGEIAPHVTILIKGGKTGTKSGTDGVYTIKKIPEGIHQIVASMVGLQTIEKSVKITSNEVSTVDFTLGETFHQLQEVTIIGGSGLKSDIMSPSLRLTIPILDVPQNIQVVTGAAIANQQIISMSDGLLRNISGAVRSEHWGDLYTNVNMRGSQVQAFRNGFNVVASFWGPLTEDMSVVDRVEFIKGPAGFMLGTGDPSGLYNVVTKKPTGKNRGEISFTTGSFDLYRGAVDIDRKLTSDGKLLFRFNGAYQKRGSFRPFEHNDRISAAPVISYQFSNKTKLTVEYNLQHANMTDVGSYYVFAPNGYATLPRNFTLAQPGTEPTRINDHNLYANFQHALNRNWKLTAQAAYFHYNQKGGSSWPAAVGPGAYDLNFDGSLDGTLAAGQLIRSYGIWDAQSRMKLGQIFINGEIVTGHVRHKILAGIDAGKKDYEADWGQSHQYDTPDKPFHIHHPDYSAPANGFPHFDRNTKLSDRAKKAGGLMGQQYVSGYIQDELGFFKNTLRLTLAGRYGYMKQYQWGGDAYQKAHFTPRLGVSYSVDHNTSLYALYDQAFIPQSGMVRVGSVKPITGNNMEIGLKRDWFGGKWNTTIAVYRIVKQNELTGDPFNKAGENFSIIIGEKAAKGLELDLKGEIAPGFGVIVNYALTENKVTRVAPGVTTLEKGELIPTYAKHTANTWISYTFQQGKLKGFGINAGFTYQGDRVGWGYSEAHPERNLPDYFKLDGGLTWQSKRITVTANVFNILNKYLYSGAAYTGYWNNPDYNVLSYSWQAEPPRNLRLGVAYKF